MTSVIPGIPYTNTEKDTGTANLESYSQGQESWTLGGNEEGGLITGEQIDPNAAIPQSAIVNLINDIAAKATASAVPTKVDLAIFNVKDYGAVGNGTANDYPAFQAAYNAAVVAGGIVYMPPGTYYLNSATYGIVTQVATGTAPPPVVIWRGAGRGVTTVKLSTNCRGFTSTASASGIDKWAGNMGFENFTVDNNNVVGSNNNYGVLYDNINYNNIDNMWWERVDTINVKEAVVSGVERRNINISVSGSAALDISTQIQVTNIRVEKCIFGRTGWGGNYGVLIQGYTAGGNTGWPLLTGQMYRTYVYFDNIVIRDCIHNGGTKATGSTTYSATNFMVGSTGYGDRVRIENCYGQGSPDDGIEVNSMHDVVIKDCVIYNCNNAAVYMVNLGGMVDPERQVYRVENCFSYNTAGFQVAQPSGRPPFGNAVLENCKSVGTAFKTYGNFRTFAVKGYRGWHSRTYNGSSSTGIATLTQAGGRSRVIFSDVLLEETAIQSGGTSTGALTVNSVNFDNITDLNLEIRDLDFRHQLQQGWQAASRPGFNVQALTLMGGNHGNYQSAMTTSDDSVFYDDAGLSADYSNSATGLTPGGNNLTTELRRVLAYHSGDYFYGCTEPGVDVCTSVTGTPGTTTTDFKVGCGKWIATTDYVGAYITDDGTTSFLCLDKVVDGTRTSLLGTIVGGGAGTVTAINTPTSYQSDRGIALASRIATGTAFTVRLLAKGNTFTADYWAVAQRSNANASGATATATATVSAIADINGVGNNRQGRVFHTFVPIDTAARMKDHWYDRLTVVRGLIDGMRILENKYVNTFDGLIIKANSSFLRIDTASPLRIRNCDFTQAIGSFSTITDFNLSSADTTVARGIHRFNNSQAKTTAAGTITVPASGSAYTPTINEAMTIDWTGGTLTTPFVEVSVDGGTTWTQKWASNTKGQLVLYPYDQIRWTYSSVPTVTRTPLNDWGVANALAGRQAVLQG